MNNVVSIDPIKRGADWVIDNLIRMSESKQLILRFTFPQSEDDDFTNQVFAPDDVRLRDLLMARAILDDLIHDLMRNQRV